MTIIIILPLLGCGADGGVKATVPANNGGNINRGPDLRGTVEMPNGQLARSDSLLRRIAAAALPEAAALTADVSPVGDDVIVELVELRQEDLDLGADPPVLDRTTTNAAGEYLISLPGGTNENQCRFMLQVGSRETGTLTRAFVFSIRESLVIDFRSEAVVRLILSEIPPADLCDFDADDIDNIYQAVVDAPGDIFAVTVAGVNAIAFGLARDDPGVQAAIEAAL
jgi:hypothetical protein